MIKISKVFEKKFDLRENILFLLHTFIFIYFIFIPLIYFGVNLAKCRKEPV